MVPDPPLLGVPPLEEELGSASLELHEMARKQSAAVDTKRTLNDVMVSNR